ncbi:TIGR03842 family LLM class F420-dependent oxidoreductase [Nocardioides sp. AN3]|jgi:alkanesulfonate monooxygenase SsuD/methylene tetrahydromethanopterin reductase-like flavin-dependent oxidoreductase (luciferase family)
MKFGIISVFPPAARAVELLQLAERLDFDDFWVADSHVIWNEVSALMGYLAGQSTSTTMRFGMMVGNPVSRDPLVVASAMATLRQILGEGRVLCGMGRGDSVVRVVGRKPSTISELESAMKLIRTTTSGDTATVDDGTDVHMPWVSGKAIPVIAAAYGPRMLAAAGRSADGVIIECADPSYISWAMDHVRAGAAEVGRDLTDFEVVAANATCVSENLDQARETVRPFGAVIGNMVAEIMRNVGANNLPPDFEALNNSRTEYDYYKHVHSDTAQADYVPDEMIDRLTIIGTAERCAERVRELEAVGVTRICFYSQTSSYEADMMQYSEHVLPLFRDSAGVAQVTAAGAR